MFIWTNNTIFPFGVLENRSAKFNEKFMQGRFIKIPIKHLIPVSAILFSRFNNASVCNTAVIVITQSGIYKPNILFRVWMRSLYIKRRRNGHQNTITTIVRYTFWPFLAKITSTEILWLHLKNRRDEVVPIFRYVVFSLRIVL